MALDLPSIILQAGQQILQGVQGAQQLQLQRQRMKEHEQLAEENFKLRETQLKLAQEKLQLEIELAPLKLAKQKADTAVAVATAPDKIEQEKLQTSQGVLGLEKLNQDIEFNNQMEPYRLTIAQSNATLKKLEAEAATAAGGAPDALSKTLTNINQKSIIQGRLVSIAEDAGKLHVKRAATRNQILGGLGTGFVQKYGSREYGWFYAQRDALTKALQADPNQRKASLAAAGITAGDSNTAVKLAGEQVQEINQVIGAFEGEVSKFVSSAIDLNQVPVNLREMARNIALASGTGPQSAGTFVEGGTTNPDGTTTPSPAQTAPEVQLEKISTADIPTAVEEVKRMAGDLSRAKGISGAAAISQILNSMPDNQRRQAIFAELTKSK